jgi:hypothetical protein
MDEREHDQQNGRTNCDRQQPARAAIESPAAGIQGSISERHQPVCDEQEKETGQGLPKVRYPNPNWEQAETASPPCERLDLAVVHPREEQQHSQYGREQNKGSG